MVREFSISSDNPLSPQRRSAVAASAPVGQIAAVNGPSLREDAAAGELISARNAGIRSGIYVGARAEAGHNAWQRRLELMDRV